MGIRTTDKTLPEGVQPAFLLKRQSVFEHIAHHVSAMEARNIDRKASVRPHLAVHTAQHSEVIGRYLLEVTQLILGVDTNTRHAIKAALRGTLVLHQFHQWLDLEAVNGLLLGCGVWEHQSAAQIRVVRDGHDIAVAIGFETLGSELAP